MKIRNDEGLSPKEVQAWNLRWAGRSTDYEGPLTPEEIQELEDNGWIFLTNYPTINPYDYVVPRRSLLWKDGTAVRSYTDIPRPFDEYPYNEYRYTKPYIVQEKQRGKLEQTLKTFEMYHYRSQWRRSVTERGSTDDSP